PLGVGAGVVGVEHPGRLAGLTHDRRHLHTAAGTAGGGEALPGDDHLGPEGLLVAAADGVHVRQVVGDGVQPEPGHVHAGTGDVEGGEGAHATTPFMAVRSWLVVKL